MRRLGVALALGMAVVAASAAHPKEAATASGKVGLAVRTFHPKATRNWRDAEHKELRVRVWYPAIASAIETKQYIGAPDAPLMEAGSAAQNAPLQPSLDKFPLIVLSHGTGGSAAQMAWLGTALARAGFIAAAVDHPGNNSTEPYTPAGFLLWWERATDLSEVIDGMLADPEFGQQIDDSRIGAAGFSIGGYTVLELGGAETDVSQYYDLCKAKPDKSVCHIPEMSNMPAPALLLEQVRKTSGESLARSGESYRDARVRAVFAIAPPARETLTAESLHAMRVPVEVVVGAADDIAPAEDSLDYVRQNVRGMRGFVLPGGVGHYTFLDTCTPAGKQTLGRYCEDAPNVDRDAVHAQVAGMAVAFFNKELRLK
jgi:predicted dienelactone hydrolase